MDTVRTGRIFGWFFIGTFITSIPARLLVVDGLGATWTDTVFNPGAVSDTSLQLGSILEFGVIVTNIATAVVIYPLVGIGNGLLLGYLMYRSGLVPPRMAVLGLVGGPLLIVSFVLILFGAYENGSGPAGLMALPEIAWEASLAIYSAWKGFRPSPIADSPSDR